MMTFVRDIGEAGKPGTSIMGGRDRELIFDDAVRESLTETYRLAVEKAAALGIETALTWHTLAMWTNDGRERVGYFARALDLLESPRDAHLLPAGFATMAEAKRMRADCLFEIGRVHTHEGDPSVARDFLLRALALVCEVSREAERVRPASTAATEDTLEGRIGELLLQLPEAEDSPAE